MSMEKINTIEILNIRKLRAKDREEGREEGVFDTRAESFKLFLSLGKDFDELAEYYKMTPAEAKEMREHLEREGKGEIKYKE